jgi:pSer/pThr/pTyr-binding forkhead associated (FHA) protein
MRLAIYSSYPMPSLILHNGPRPLKHELVGDSVSIGRGPLNDIVIDSPVVSVQHAMLVKTGDSFWLKDLNSTNGTYVNGSLFTYGELKDGDTIRFGTVTAIFAEQRRKRWATCAIRMFWANSTTRRKPGAPKGDTTKIESDHSSGAKVGRVEQVSLQHAVTHDLAIKEVMKTRSARKAVGERLLAYLDKQIDACGQTASRPAVKFWRTKIRNIKHR